METCVFWYITKKPIYIGDELNMSLICDGPTLDYYYSRNYLPSALDFTKIICAAEVDYPEILF